MSSMLFASTDIAAISLSDFAIVRVSGDDAVSFLHGQLTNDIAGLKENAACFAGYCSPKGRLLATMMVWRSSPQQLHLLMKTGIARNVIQRLRMFVLRAKVVFEPVDTPVHGAFLPAVPEPVPGQVAVVDGFACVPVPGRPDQPSRGWLAGDFQGPAAPNPESHWAALDILAGLPWIEAATQDLFIPQTVNLDLIGGVSFTKGCYPGQEVVARAHYRGTVKRRMAYGHIAAPLPYTIDTASLAGTDTYNAHRPDAPCGRVVNAVHIVPGSEAPGVRSGLHLLMEVTLGDMNEADFRLLNADGPEIRAVALPGGTTSDAA